MKIFLLIIFSLPKLLIANPLLEMATEGPRFFKTSTILDCRSFDDITKKRLWVYIFDISNNQGVIYNGIHAERKNWDRFQYKIYEENARGISKWGLQDVFEDKESIKFLSHSANRYTPSYSEYILDKKTMTLSVLLGKYTFDRGKCRYL